LVNREFGRPGLFPAEMSKLLREAFNQRQKSDYSELQPTDSETAQQMLSHAKSFIEAVRSTLVEILG
ncbi:MAG: HEPN domain-containing protein, partial [Clostridia bacterium]|nr:HEPN domain-containing protein [Clostridia bacterium]